jgi:asparagine synthase (glutamine-hydrolysing)
MSQYCGEPFADSSIVPSYLVTKEISAHLKVALSGDGGDEMFGGYKEYVAAYRADRFVRDHKSRPFWRTRLNLDKMLSRLSGRENMGAQEHYSRLTGAQRLDRQMGFDTTTRSRIWRPDVRPAGHPGETWLQQKWDEHPSTWLSDQLMRASLSTRLINDYLVKVDRSSMYHSLEVRSPFLDKSLAELAFRISPEVKFQGGTAKYLLKRLAQKYFDPAIFGRPKHGFSIPLAEWLRDTHAAYVNDVLGSRTAWLYSLLDYQEVQRIWARHRAGHDHSDGLWALLCLEAWGQGRKSQSVAAHP